MEAEPQVWVVQENDVDANGVDSLWLSADSALKHLQDSFSRDNYEVKEVSRGEDDMVVFVYRKAHPDYPTYRYSVVRYLLSDLR